MPIQLSERARDGGTFAVTVAFDDEGNDPVTPSAVTWTLLNRENQVINNRDAVPATPGASVTVVLGADDLRYADGDIRHVVFDWTYDSSLGSNLAGREQVTFVISDIREKAAG